MEFIGQFDAGESWTRANGGLDSRFTDLLEISPIDGELEFGNRR